MITFILISWWKREEALILSLRHTMQKQKNQLFKGNNIKIIFYPRTYVYVRSFRKKNYLLTKVKILNIISKPSKFNWISFFQSGTKEIAQFQILFRQFIQFGLREENSVWNFPRYWYGWMARTARRISTGTRRWEEARFYTEVDVNRKWIWILDRKNDTDKLGKSVHPQWNLIHEKSDLMRRRFRKALRTLGKI